MLRYRAMATFAAEQGATEPQGLKPALSLFDSVTIVAGSMIGSGIFIVSADIARQVQSPAAPPAFGDVRASTSPVWIGGGEER